MLRIAAVVAVGVALLPSDPQKQTELYQRAASATSWAITFCDRNAETCAQGGKLWQQFVAKAEFGARLAYDMMREGSATTIDPATPGTTYAPALYRPGDTLTDADRSAPWRGKPARKGSI